MKPAVVFLLIALCLCPAPAGAEPDAATAEVELDRVRERIRALEKQVKRSVSDRGKSVRALRKAELAASKARKDLKSLAAQVQQTGKREEWLRLLLSQQDPVNAGRQLVYYGYLTEQRSSVIDGVRDTLAELAATALAVAAEGKRLAALEASQREQLAELDAARAERATLVARLDQQIKGSQGEIAQLTQQADDLQALVEELRLAMAEIDLAGSAAFGKEKGQLPWPTDGKILHSFGQSRADGRLRWEGTLLKASSGAEVRAVHNGRVIFADWLNGMGLLMILEHGDGYMTLYGHNQDLVREVGDWVVPGEVLGHVGDSGGQSEPGLYFEIRKNGKPINPKAWLRR
jgi:septal ring factor EnvC (AmiA/AmiB activator)